MNVPERRDRGCPPKKLEAQGMEEEITAFRCSRGLRTRGCASVHFCWLLRDIRRCNGEHWGRRMATVFLDHSNRTHYRSSQGHTAPGIDIGHGGAGRIFDRRDKCCLRCPSTNRKFRRVNLRWRLPFRGCLRFIRNPVCGPGYLLGARSRDLTSIVR